VPADALRRGFSEARGEILAWLNADDTYEPQAVRRGVEYLTAHPDVDVVYGDGWWTDEGGQRIRPYATMPFDPRMLERDCFICQPASFMRSSAYRNCEMDARLPVSFDYDLWIRMAAQGRRFAYLPRHLANSRMHRSSLTISRRLQVFRVSMALLQRHYGYVPLSWVLGYVAFRMDGRDQFFEPLRLSPLKFLISLPAGLRYNRSRPVRYFAEWLLAPFKAVLRRCRRV
jgi:glycosyltransferase involved in cell wall biosynthesis